ncbi:MAG: hypothetical protein KJO79_09955, partial [Verrucomicrobiae bacterium]|nr:hypothetical protein [Verrucomicrobiae bacterium]NNJ87494.1 hypothetical protein [Akkermansiaceae bacterium]
SSGNGYNGSIIGSGDLNVPGRVGSGYEPGGNGSYGRVPDGVSACGIGGNAARTVAFWFKTPNFGGASDQYRMIGIGSGAGAAFNIVAESGTGANRVGIRYGNGNVYFNADNIDTAFAADTWYHVAIVYDGTTLDLEAIGTPSDGTGLIVYVNGIQTDTAAGNLNNGSQSLNTAATDVTFGANTDGSFSLFPGQLDEVRVYNSVLGAAEIATLAGAAGTLPDIQSFTSSESTVEAGTQVTLSWSASDYDTLVIEPGSIDAAALSTNGSGSTQITVSATTTYTLTAGKDGNTTSRSVEVRVGVANPIEANPRPSLWTQWYRPVDQPVFSTTDGNNHDAVIFYEPSGYTYKYYMIVSHESSNAFLWATNTFSWDSADWTLIEGNYQINGQYEYDDGVRVGDTYYLYENGKVLTYTGDLINSNGNWTVAGTFPANLCDDIGVFYEDGVFHIFGEYGNFPPGPDGTSLSHYTSTTGVGNWTLVDNKAVDPNPDGGNTYGVGDATIIKVDGTYYLFCDLETAEDPYRVIAWSTTDINQPFQYLGLALVPREDETDDWDNYRIQDADILYVPELKRFVMVCNMLDKDGNNPDGVAAFPGVGGTRVVGTFYSKVTNGGVGAFLQGFPDITGNDALADADPDQDGATNAEEYAGGTLPNHTNSYPLLQYTQVSQSGLDYPAIVFDRIISDTSTTRTGEASNLGSLAAGAFSPAQGVEVQTDISEIGGFYERVIYRSTEPITSPHAQFLRVRTTHTVSP